MIAQASLEAGVCSLAGASFMTLIKGWMVKVNAKPLGHPVT